MVNLRPIVWYEVLWYKCAGLFLQALLDAIDNATYNYVGKIMVRSLSYGFVSFSVQDKQRWVIVIWNRWSTETIIIALSAITSSCISQSSLYHWTVFTWEYKPWPSSKYWYPVSNSTNYLTLSFVCFCSFWSHIALWFENCSILTDYTVHGFKSSYYAEGGGIL